MTHIAAQTSLFIGDSSPIWEVAFQTSAEGVTPIELATLDGTYSCRIAVQGTAIDRAITEKTADNKYFRAWLTPAETLQLTPGIKMVGIQIKNDSLTPPLVLEYQVVLNVSQGIVPNT